MIFKIVFHSYVPNFYEQKFCYATRVKDENDKPRFNVILIFRIKTKI